MALPLLSFHLAKSNARHRESYANTPGLVGAESDAQAACSGRRTDVAPSLPPYLIPTTTLDDSATCDPAMS
jgi:hypothetical protein